MIEDNIASTSKNTKARWCAKAAKLAVFTTVTLVLFAFVGDLVQSLFYTGGPVVLVAT